MKLPDLPQEEELDILHQNITVLRVKGYSTATLRAYGKACVFVALEEAAKHIIDGGQYGETRKRIAMRVRALKEQIE